MFRLVKLKKIKVFHPKEKLQEEYKSAKSDAGQSYKHGSHEKYFKFLRFMDSKVEVTPWKKRKSNFLWCVICQENAKNKHIVKAPNTTSLEKLITACKTRHQHRDDSVYKLFQMIGDTSIDDLVQKRVVYHKECYKEVTNVKTINQIVKRYTIAIESDSPTTIINRISGRPIRDNIEESTGPEVQSSSRRSNTVAYDKDSCIICQISVGKLHKVAYMRTGRTMLEVASKLSDKGFYLRLNTIPNASDAVANDVTYHLKCWVNAQRKAEPKCSVQETNDFQRVVCDIEFINLIKYELQNPTGIVIDMNLLNKRYKELLDELMVQKENIKDNYKPYIKQLIVENVSNAEFIKAPRRNEPERVCSKETSESSIDAAIKQNTQENLTDIFAVSSVIRKELLSHDKWNFQGSFDDFTLPSYLPILLKWILVGPRKEISCEGRKKSVDKDISVISQLILQAVKTRRQVDYKQQGQSNNEYYVTRETPLSVGLGLHMYTKTRSKEIVNVLSNLGLSIPYKKVCSIKDDIVADTKAKIAQNGGVYIPPMISPNKPLFFAIDNIDFQVDTPDGRGQLHGTTQVVFQQKDIDESYSIDKFERNNKSKKSTPIYDVTHCAPPKSRNDIYPCFDNIKSIEEVDIYRHWDLAWALARNFDETASIPTWSAHNSLHTEGIPLTNYCTTPVLHGSPTDWSNLYTALKIVQGINVATTADHKTVVSLDLQLYSKCIQLQAKDNIYSNFVFRLGELHILFAMLKVIGKNINCSGLDEAMIEANIYGPTTMEQIKGGKHYKRSFEAYLTLYMSLFHVYTKEFFTDQVVLKIATQEAVSVYATYEDYKFTDFVDELAGLTLFDSLKEFDRRLTGQAKFLRNFMDLIEIMLLFVRATRQGLWELHLASLERFTKYFFAYDQINYARLTPVYLSEMYALKSNDVKTWDFLSENFSVNKSNVPFCALGTDHALEQENKNMKVLGGITGITNQQNTLENYFLASPILNNISERFCNTFAKLSHEKKVHHQLLGSSSTRYSNNVNKLIEVFENHDINFGRQSDVFNLVTKVVLPPIQADIFLLHDKVGKKMFDTFKLERLQGEKSVWDPVVKRKLPTFVETTKKVQMKINDKVVQLKEEKQLMTKFVVASRTRGDIDLPHYFGKYEFSVVPRSLFHQDGSLILGTDKSVVMHEIENLMKEDMQEQSDLSLNDEQPGQRVIIFDGMAVVNRIKKTAETKTCKDLAISFNRIVLNESRGYGEIRMIFDRYQENSIKDQTRSKRTHGTQIRYKIADDANIQTVPMKKLLSHVITKHELTKYLGDHLAKELQLMGRRYVVVYHNQCLTNIPDFSPDLLHHNHEEADTLLILHSIDVATMDPFKEVTICSPDTDVFLLLVYYQPSLCSQTVFRTGRGQDVRDIDIKSAYEVIGSERVSALLGYHSITGCDFTAKFNGKSKLSTWKRFFSSGQDVLQALSKLSERCDTPLDNVFFGLEKFVLDLYCPKRPNSVVNLSELRWYLFSKYQWTSEKLPPTSSTLKMKILRSYFVANIWSQSHKPIMDMLDPIRFGWERSDDNKLVAISTLLPPAPDVIVEMSLCRCKTPCNTMRCACKKVGLICTEMCFCENCENDDSTDQTVHSGDSETDSDSDIEQ